MREDCPGPLVAWYRHISKGAWPFSTRDHGWPISDCSSEGLKVLASRLVTPTCAKLGPHACHVFSLCPKVASSLHTMCARLALPLSVSSRAISLSPDL